MREDADPEVYAEITVVASTVTNEGLTSPGEVVKRLNATPKQLLRLLDLLGSIDAFRALLLAVEHGELRLDPIRIEIPGWKREWLMAKGMTESRAKSAVSALKKAGFIEKVYGDRGAAGGGVAILGGSRFAWPEAVTQVISETGRPRLVVAGETVDSRASTQVSTFGREASKRAVRPVDNREGAFGQSVPERTSGAERLDTVRPVVLSPDRQVSAIGQVASERPFTPAPSKEVEEEETLLAAAPGSGGPLTRTNLHRFLGERVLREALNNREVAAVTSLARLFAANPTSTSAALAFFNRPAGDSPDVDLAWFVYDLLTVSGTDVATVADSLGTLLRTKHARIPKMGNEELIRAVVLSVVVAMDKEPRTWPAFVVWVASNEAWGSSSSIRALVDCLNRIVFAPATGEPVPPMDDEDLAPVASAAHQSVLGLPDRRASDLPGELAPHIEELRSRGDAGYREWMISEVLTGTEFSDPASIDVVLRNQNMQDALIRAYRRRTVTEPTPHG